MKTKAHPFVVMIAGEASGDLHGAHVIQSLRKRYEHITVAGAGGTAMQAAGAENVIDIRQLSVMGFSAIITKAPQLLRALRRLKHLISSARPHLVVLIDFPDFNLHLAGFAKKLGIPVLYYISPQLWAWRSRRVLKIKRRVDHMAVILPFELSFYQQYDVPVTFVGHPLMDGPLAAANRLRPPSSNDEICMALLPGSREGEVRRILPQMLKAASILQKKLPGIRILISHAPTIDQQLMKEISGSYPLTNVETTAEPVIKLFERSHLTIVSSGTASLEAAIFGIPAILVYAMSTLTYTVGKLLIRVPHIGMANLIAQKRVIPELIQENAVAENIAAEAMDLLSNPQAYQNMQRELARVRQRMGSPGASDRVAEIAGRLMAN